MKGKIDFDLLLLRIGKSTAQYRKFRKEDIVVTASEIGIPVEILEAIERGTYKEISLDLITVLANYFNVTLQELFDLQIVQVFNYSQNVLPGERAVTLKNEQADGYKMYINDLKEDKNKLKQEVQRLESELKTLK